jgi:hypothetical protein
VDLIHALLKLKSNDIQVNRIFVNYYYNNNRNKFQTQYTIIVTFISNRLARRVQKIKKH